MVVFDFDGTLVRGDSVTGFAVEYLLKRPGRLLFVLPCLPFAVMLMLFGRTRSAGVSWFWWQLTFGTRARPLALALARYAGTTLAERGNAATLGEFAAHLGQGNAVVVATAAPALIVHRLLAAKGLVGARVVGTRVLRRFGGLVARPHCIGETKVSELARRFGLASWDEVYSDSALDLPLMRRASAVTLVAPSRHSRALVTSALPKSTSLRLLT